MLIYVILGAVIAAGLIVMILFIRSMGGKSGMAGDGVMREVIVNNGVNVKTAEFGKSSGSYFDTENMMNPTRLVNGEAPARWHVRLLNQGTGEQYRFSFSDGMTIGRASAEYAQEIKLVLPSDRLISKTHCRISDSNGGLVLSDLGSKNHTYLNGNCLTQPAWLRPGDEIAIGNTILKIRFVQS